MIFVSNKLRYLFDGLLKPINENGEPLGKLVYAEHHYDEIKDIPYDDWDVLHLNGISQDFRSSNLELVIFKD